MISSDACEFMSFRDWKIYMEELRTERFSHYPFDGLVKEILEEIPCKILFDDNFYLVRDYHQSYDHVWPYILENIVRIIHIADNSIRISEGNILITLWNCLPAYFKKFPKYYGNSTDRQKQLIFLHGVLTNKSTIDLEDLTLSESIDPQYVLSLDEGIIVEATNFTAHHRFGRLGSKSKERLRAAIMALERCHFNRTDIDNILQVITTEPKNSLYYNISTLSFVKLSSIKKAFNVNNKFHFVSKLSNTDLFKHISEILKNPGVRTRTAPEPSRNIVNSSEEEKEENSEENSDDDYEIKESDDSTESSEEELENPKREPHVKIEESIPKSSKIEEIKFDEIESSNKKSSRKEPAKRKSIPAKVRQMTWRKYIGSTMDGNCWCCGTAISFEGWHAGHVIPASKGGPDTVPNLRPLCASCNLSMGNMAMSEFISRYGMTGVGAEEFKNIETEMGNLKL